MNDSPLGSRLTSNRRLPQARVEEIADLLGVSVAALCEDRRERVLHASADGERWLLVSSGDGVLVRHIASAAAGRHDIHMRLDTFLQRDVGTPQHAALLALMQDVLATHLAL